MVYSMDFEEKLITLLRYHYLFIVLAFFLFLNLLFCIGVRQWHPTPVLLPGKSHGRRSLVGCNPWGGEESDTTERLHFHFSLSCIGEGNGNPLQCSCLENPRDRGAWWAAVYGVAHSRTRLKRLSSSSSVVYWKVWQILINCFVLIHQRPPPHSPVEDAFFFPSYFRASALNFLCRTLDAVVHLLSCVRLVQPLRLSPARFHCPWDSLGKNTGLGCHFLLQGIFLTQGLDPGLLHCGWILYWLNHQGSPGRCFW